MSDSLSKRMSQGMEEDPGSPEIVQELLDVITLLHIYFRSLFIILNPFVGDF
jgi:hypothetical protein